jgi:hypothetical protein
MAHCRSQVNTHYAVVGPTSAAVWAIPRKDFGTNWRYWMARKVKTVTYHAVMRRDSGIVFKRMNNVQSQFDLK